MTQINGILDCRQPDTKSWILFSGEIHNRLEVNQALRRIGCSLNSGSDSELVSTAYHVWGPECQHRLNGAWAFVIWNAHHRHLVCARDRFGIEPELTAKMARGKWRVYEVGISYAGRDYAEGKKITWRDGLAALWAVFRFRFFD